VVSAVSQGADHRHCPVEQVGSNRKSEGRTSERGNCVRPSCIVYAIASQLPAHWNQALIPDIATGVRLCQDSSESPYSPMILTSTRFRRRPSRLPGQPFRLALKDPLSWAEVEPAIGHRDHHGFAWRPITRNLASCVPFQVRVGIPVTSFRIEQCDYIAQPIQSAPPRLKSGLVGTKSPDGYRSLFRRESCQHSQLIPQPLS
jgi:hypothetical protein